MESDDSDEDFVSADEGDDDDEGDIGIKREEVCKADQEKICDTKENLDDDHSGDIRIHNEHEHPQPGEIREVEGPSADDPEEYEVDEDKQKSNHSIKEDIMNASHSGDGVDQLLLDEGTTSCSKVTENVIIENSLEIGECKDEGNMQQMDAKEVVATLHKEQPLDNIEHTEYVGDKKDTDPCIDQLTIQDKTMKKESPEEVLLEIPTNARTECMVNECLEKEVTVDLHSGNIAEDFEIIKTEKTSDGDIPEIPSDVGNTDVANTDGGDNTNVANTDGGDNTDVANTDESWGWDSWADNFISQATSKVSTLMESVEEQLGIPDPALVAHNLKVEGDKAEEMKEEEMMNTKGVTGEEDGKNIDTKERENASSWFSSYLPVTSITNLVQSKGQELVSGGIDALEFIGKSTVNYLSEGDPGLRNKRKAFRNKGETLSSILQEAKLKADEREVSDSPRKGEDPKKLNDMLEKFQAIAHLDALQMLSSSCETKLERILNVQSEEVRDESSRLINDLKENFEIEENEENKVDVDFKKDVFSSTKMLKMKITCSKLLNTWLKLKKRTDAICFENSDECFENCISSLAEFVSRCIEYYRKVADMLIMADVEAKQLAVERATILKSVSEMFLYEISDIATKFANYLANEKEDKVACDFITDIYFESANSSSLLHDSHMLLLPVLQCSAIK